MTQVGLAAPVALGVVMLSLGLSLRLIDFRRVLQYPRAMVVALGFQVLMLPLICFLLVLLFRLPPELAVGMMLLAASPGGPIANVFSHLADGDLALNISLTALNSVLSIVTLPLVVMAALAYFMDDGRVVPPQFAKVMQVFAVILLPVAIGMLIRAVRPGLAERLGKPVKLLAVIFLLIVALMAVQMAWRTVLDNFAVLGGCILAFALISLLLGYWVPRLARLDHRQSIAISMEIGLHNGALAIAIALSPQLLNDPVMAIPPLIYGGLSPLFAAAFLLVLRRFAGRRAPTATA